MNKWTKTDRYMSASIYGSFVLLLAFLGCRLSLPMVLDETGTMSVAAFLTGGDWSLTNLAMGSHYYKYLPGIFYAPFFAAIKDPFLRYRAIMLLHACLAGLIPFLVYRICRQFLGRERPFSLLTAAAVGSLNAVLLFSLYARGDAFVEVFPWLAVYTLFCARRAARQANRSGVIRNSILTAVFSVACYASHTRGIVLVIAITLTIGFFSLVWKEKPVSFLAYGISLLVGLLGDHVLSHFFREKVLPFGAKHATFDVFSFSSLKSIFSGQGLKVLVRSGAGWLFNTTVSTFGLALLGLLIGLCLFVYGIQRRQGLAGEAVILSFFGWIYYLGNLGIGLLFFYPHLYRFFYSGNPARADRVTFCRYIACAFGFLCLIAFYGLENPKDIVTRKWKIVSAAIFAGVLAFYARWVAKWMGLGKLTIRNLSSLCRFVHISKAGTTFGNFPDLPSGLKKMGLYALAVFLILLILSEWKRKKTGMLILLSLVFLLNLENISHDYRNLRLARDTSLLPRMEILYQAFRQYEDVPDSYKNVYLDSSISIRTVQYILTDYVCADKRGREYLPENAFYVLKDEEAKKVLEDKESLYLGDIRYGKKRDEIYAVGTDLIAYLSS